MQIAEANRLGLTRKTFEFNQWVDTSFLTAALRELQLETFWRPRDGSGQPGA